MSTAAKPLDCYMLLLASTRAAYLWFHAAHHLTSGASFYGDHKAYSRQYEAYVKAFDSITERGMLFCGDAIASPVTTTRIALDILGTLPPVAGSADEIAVGAVAVTRRFLSELQTARGGLRQCGALTSGTENLLSQLSDDHEASLYQLRQRSRGGT